MASLYPHPFRTNAKNAHGTSPAGEGPHHWVMQRLTAILLIPLASWLAYTLITKMVGAPIEEAQAWAADPAVGVALATFIIAVCVHAAMGLQVVIEDYVSKKCCKFFMLVVIKLGYFVLMLAGLAAIIKLAFM